jgi:hypothetical protein
MVRYQWRLWNPLQALRVYDSVLKAGANSKSQIPNHKSLAQTDLTSEVFNASTAKPEKYKGINQASRTRAGSNKFQ